MCKPEEHNDPKDCDSQNKNKNSDRQSNDNERDIPHEDSSEYEEKLSRYADSVRTLAENSSKLVFGNEDSNHAAIVMENIFRYSNETIRIYANLFNGAVSNNEKYCDALKAFIKQPGSIVKVICENDPNRDSEGFKLLYEYSKLTGYSNKIIIKKSGGLIAEKLSNSIGKYFTVGDNKRFRLEVNPEKFEAIASFNNEETCNKLIEIFDEEFNNLDTATHIE